MLNKLKDWIHRWDFEPMKTGWTEEKEAPIPPEKYFKTGDTIFVKDNRAIYNSRYFSENTWIEYFLQNKVLPYTGSAYLRHRYDNSWELLFGSMAPSKRFYTVVKEFPNRAWVKKVFRTSRVYVVTNGLENFWIDVKNAEKTDKKFKEVWS